MNNARRIVGEGKALGLPRRAYVLAVACAMQESRLLNLASSVLPESYSYPHEGSGSDHDSVGLFQQRPSSGWGSVRDLMTPAYAAKQFYSALVAIPGWAQLPLTVAIQAVQVSAFSYLPSVMLSGFMFPFNGMPGWAQVVGEIIPLTHYIRATRDVLLRGEGPAAVWEQMGPVAAFTAVAFAVAIVCYRRRLD